MIFYILKVRRHKLLIAHGWTFLTPSLHGWTMILTPEAITHTMMSWTFSPMSSQVLYVNLRPPWGHGVTGTSYGEVCNMCRRKTSSRFTQEMTNIVWICELKSPPPLNMSLSGWGILFHNSSHYVQDPSLLLHLWTSGLLDTILLLRLDNKYLQILESCTYNTTTPTS